MKKRLCFAILAGLVLAALCLSAALAADPLKVSMELSASRFSAPETIAVSISVTNTGSCDLAGPVTLYDPDGRMVEAFGTPTLAAGESRNWTGEWTVTQSQLEAGKITFMIRYTVYSGLIDENGQNTQVRKAKRFSKKILYTGPGPGAEAESPTPAPAPEQPADLAVSAAFDREAMAGLPEAVYLTVSVRNTGAGEAKNVRVKSDDTVLHTFASIPAGETVSFRRDVLISMEGRYIFTAECSNGAGGTLRFSSPGIELRVVETGSETIRGAAAERPTIGGADGWEVLDVSGIPLRNPYTVPMTRSELMAGGMLLVNEWHPRPDDFDETGVVSVGKRFAGGEKIQVRDSSVALFPAAADALHEALLAAKAEGLEHYLVEEGFRTYEQQDTYFRNRTAKLSSRYTGDELIAEVKKEVNYPGTSEYNSGLAFELRLYDRNDPGISMPKYSSTDQARWMNANCWRYGIVFRFPQDGWPLETSTDKSFKTGVDRHVNVYRYVGKGNAAAMHFLDFSMEEYIEFLQKHPHIALYEGGTLKYEIFRQYFGEASQMDVQLTRDARDYSSSLDNMGAVITVFEY